MLSIQDITPDWLIEILRSSGQLQAGYVTSVTVPAGALSETEGPGFQPGNRLLVEYAPGTRPVPPTRLYLKMQTEVLHKEAGAREVNLYQQAVNLPQFPAPRCLYAAYDRETGAYQLLLEDLSATHRTVHPEEPVRQTDADQMLEVLARLHASRWGQAPPAELPTSEDIRADFAQLTDAFSGYAAFLDDRLSPERRRIYERVLARYPAYVLQRLQQIEQLTLIHQDAHAGNFLLPRQVGRPVLIDWQQWGYGSGLQDVAYLIALFWYPERRGRFEAWAVQRYHHYLCEYGVQQFDWQACWTDYRWQVIGNLLVPLWAWLFQGPNWSFHRWHQLEKAMLAYQDLDCDTLFG